MSSASLPEHIHRPHLRPIQPIPVQKDGRQLVVLRDPVMLSEQSVVIPPQIMPVLKLFQGQQTLEQITEKVKGDLKQITEFTQGLDRVGLLWGPTFEQLEAKMQERLRAEGSFRPRAAASLGEDEAACRTKIDSYFAETEDPELGTAVTGIVAPHLDYERGWPNYATAYYPLRDMQPPDRVVILGTNHFGIGDGVVLTEFGFRSPLGTSPADAAVVGKLIDKLGRPIIVDQLDHAAEHSIELHMPWLHYCFGPVPVVAALIPDPFASMISDDGARVGIDQFVECLRTVLDEAGGATFFIASSDLSHVGPQFGEPRPIDEQRRMDVESHDRDMLAKYVAGDPEEFLSAMKWNRNPTRWCSIGNMTAALQLAQPQTIELLDYRQAYDDRGLALVSCAAMAFV